MKKFLIRLSAISSVMARNFARRRLKRLNKALEWLRWPNKPVVSINRYRQTELSSQRMQKIHSQLPLFKSIERKNVSSMHGKSKRMLNSDRITNTSSQR